MDNVCSAVLHRSLLVQVIYLNYYYYFINFNFSNEASKLSWVYVIPIQ